MAKFKCYCTMGNYFLARPLLTPFILEKLEITKGSKEEKDLEKMDVADFLRILMKRSPEIGMLYLYVESFSSAVKATGYDSHSQNRVFTLTKTGLLTRPERSYEETKHGNRPELDGQEMQDERILREYAEKANRTRSRSAIRAKIESAVKIAKGEITVWDEWMEEAGPITLSK